MLFRTAFEVIIKMIDSYGKNMEKKMIRNKKERKCSRRQNEGTLTPMSEPGEMPAGKVSFCTSENRWKKGSMAIETAMVLPLFFLGIVTILSFMDVYKLETEKLVSLCEKVKETGMYAYVLDESGPQDVTLPDFYTYTPVGGFFPLPKVWLHNVVTAHAWTGKDTSSENTEETTEERMVWVAETGAVYHENPKCSYLNLSIQEITGTSVSRKRNIYGEHYGACETCSRNQNPSSVVYITDSGNNYHNLASCSGLKRTARLVPYLQIEGMHVCSRCG